MIVNHFKSKGSGTDDGTGQGNANDRTGSRQAQRAGDLRQRFAADARHRRGLPGRRLQRLLAGGPDPGPRRRRATPTSSRPTTRDEESYNFDGLVGSLDHVLANAAADGRWSPASTSGTINANESVYYEYSRYNYNVTDLYDDRPVPRPPTTTRRSSASTCPTCRAGHAGRSRSSAPTTSTVGC